MRSCVSVVLVALWLLGGGHALAQSVQRPVYKVGDSWTYRYTDGPISYERWGNHYSTETKTVTSVAADYFEMSTLRESEGEKTSGIQLSSLDFNDFVQLAPESPRQEVRAWQWPVDVGGTWRYEEPRRNETLVWEARVKGWEVVEVPAGKFRALKVERELITASGSIGRSVTVWYSPEVKANVKLESRGAVRSYTRINLTRELLSYSVH